MHALPANWVGKPSVAFCAGHVIEYPSSHAPKSFSDLINCDEVISPATDTAIMNQTFRYMEKYNIVHAVTSGSISMVKKWKKANPDKIIAGMTFTLGYKISADSLKKRIISDDIKVFGEIGPQYDGLPADDPSYEPYWAMAEEMNIPVGIHIGAGPVGAALMGFTTFRGAAGDPMNMENVLLKHPKLKVYVMHAGWPRLENMILLMYLHPQVYVDISAINYMIPTKEFHSYLKRLVDAGFGKRIMWGSDQMIWPKTIEAGIEAIESATFLTKQQKRDIFYNNAVKFFNLPSQK